MFIPNTEMTREKLFRLGLGEGESFLSLNRITPPRFEVGRQRKFSKWTEYGFYSLGVVHVNVDHTATPVKVPGYRWSYPCYKSDVTAAGVVSHEIGHHVWSCLRLRREDWRAKVIHEAKVTSYEPNWEEAFAESFRLFVLNPELLREGRPRRWEALLGYGLKPTHAEPWRTILRNAHPKILSVAESWVRQGRVGLGGYNIFVRPNGGKQMLEVVRKEANHLFRKMGYSKEQVLGWDEKKMLEKVRALEETPDEDIIKKCAGDGRALQLAQNILNACVDNDEIKLVSLADSADANGHVQQDVEVKPEKEKTVSERNVTEKPARQVKEKAPRIPRDKYGCREGRPPAIINAVISGRPQTAEQIAEKCGQPVARVKTHLRYWLKEAKGLGEVLQKDENDKWFVEKKTAVTA